MKCILASASDEGQTVQMPSVGVLNEKVKLNPVSEDGVDKE
jgi:hypothetical protein